MVESFVLDANMYMATALAHGAVPVTHDRDMTKAARRHGLTGWRWPEFRERLLRRIP